MPRMALGLSYDGAGWLGWQTQPNRRTIQDVLEAALARFVGQSVATVCAGRTDTGVHAAMQVVHFDTSVERRDVSWVRGLNAYLPPSVAVRWARVVPDDFHARFSARSRTYVYLLWNDRVRAPFWSGRAAWCFQPLNLDAMCDASQWLLGEHDFSSFRSSQCQAAHPVRVMHDIQWRRHGSLLIATLRANAFLHHMVRNIMGAMVHVGQGRLSALAMRDLLACRDRRLAPPTYSPDGLYLAAIAYPDHAVHLGELDASTQIPGLGPTVVCGLGTDL